MTNSITMAPTAADTEMTTAFSDDCVVPSEAGCVVILIGAMGLES